MDVRSSSLEGTGKIWGQAVVNEDWMPPNTCGVPHPHLTNIQWDSDPGLMGALENHEQRAGPVGGSSLLSPAPWSSGEVCL